MHDRLKSSAEDAQKEKNLKNVTEATIWERDAALWVAEGKVKEHEGARVLAEQRVADFEAKIGEMKLRLAEVERLIWARDKEVVDLKAAFEESEDKFYYMGFVNTKSSSDPVMFQSQRYDFCKGWMAAVNALGVLEESPFKIPKLIPYPEPLPPLV